MGADSFTAVGLHPDINTAFQQAHEDAVRHYGDRGYTGSLAEKHSYTVITTTPHTREAAYRLAKELIYDDDDRIDDKWGPAGAIPLTKVTAERTASLGFKVRNSAGVTKDEVDAAVAKAIAAAQAPGETVGKIGKIQRLPIGKPLVTVAKAEGKPVVRYNVRNHLFDTEAEAIKAVRDDPARFAASFADSAPFEADLTVTPQVVGAQPSGPTTIRVSHRTVEVSFDVAFHVADTETAGWLFFGMASS